MFIKAMPTRTRKNMHLLKVLHDAKPGVRKAVLQKADKELISTICDCVHGILSGKVKISTETRKKLNRSRCALAELHSKRTGLRRKKALLVQDGGFLPALLAPILGLAASVVGGLIK